MSHSPNKRERPPPTLKPRPPPPDSSQKRKAQQNYVLKQVKNCTHMAVTHLAEKLKPLGPQLTLLHDMCFHFMKSRQTDIFDILESSSKDGDKNMPITDAGITFQGKNPEALPPHYELLTHSVGGSPGDLTRHGPKNTFIYMRHSREEKPITALALVSPDLGEEPPLGFQMISRTPGARDANLCTRTRSPPLFLCIHRGEGPPITKIAVVHIKKEKVPVGYHQISRTPNGKAPDIDMGRTVIAYRRDYVSVIKRFARYGASGDPSDMLLARCFACLVGGIYSYDRHTFLYALEAFTSLDGIKKFPDGILADFVSLVRDALTAYISYFQHDVFIKVLKWLGHVYKTRAKQLDTRGFMSMMHLCMFLRHDDSREGIGKFILQTVIKQSKIMRKHRQQIAPSPAKEQSDFQWMRGLVTDVAEHVAVVKSTEQDVIRFLNTRVIDSEFHDWASEFINSLFPHHFDRFMGGGAVLLAKVSAQELPTRLTPKSEAIKRRIHALKLLAYFLEESRSFFKSEITALVLLRRVVFSSFIQSAITPVPAVFKTMFRLHEILWLQYRTHLKFEIGVLLDQGMIGLLSSQFCTPPQKVDLLDGLMQMFRNKAALINIFYNYDNDVMNWPVCQHLVATIAKLTEGEYFTSNHYGLPETRVVQGALRLLARFMELMAKYLHAPHLNRGGNLDEQEDFDELGIDYVQSDQTRYEFLNEHKDLPFSDAQARDRAGSEVTLKDLATLAPKDTETMSVSSFGDDDTQSQGTSNPSKNPGESALRIITDGPKSSGDFSNGFVPLSNVSVSSDPDNRSTHSGDGTANLSSLRASNPDDIDKKPEISPMPVGLFSSPPPASQETQFSNGALAVKKDEAVEKKTDDDALPTINLQEDREMRQHVWEEHKSEEQWSNVQGRGDRANTWVLRYHQHKEEHKIVEEALKKARQDKLKSAVKFLLAQGGRYADLKFIAHFLYSNETLEQTEVGEFISSLETSALSQTQHQDLLLVYVGLLNFTGMFFDQAFRHFLTDCGFGLPAEAQKIDRLLVGFAHAFTRDNPSVFANQDQGLVLAYAVLMLNTELHNPKAAAAAINGPMTKQQFVRLTNSGDTQLGKEMIHQLYDSVKENPIEMKAFHQYENEDLQAVQKQFRNECSRLVQRAHAKLRDLATRKHTWQKAPNIRIVRALFDVSWHQFLAAITTVMRQTNDPQTQSECLQAIKYCCVTAIQLGLTKPELHAFSSDLAKFVFMEENKHMLYDSRHLATVKGEHLKQKWFLNLTQLSLKAPHVACEIVSRICNDMQVRVVYDHDQKTLRDLELELGDELYLVHPDRRFVKAGLLTKQSTKAELVVYRFYLFNDLLVYVSENRGKLTVHRVLQLSLCRIADLRDNFMRNIKNAFRVVSPQKNVILIAETAQDKREWFQAIESCIQDQLEHRIRWINENFITLENLHETARVSKFIGRTYAPKRHEMKRVQQGQQILKSKDLDPDVKREIETFQRQTPCKLCTRPFRRFGRKSKCPWCMDIVCNTCIHRKASVPTNKKPMKVCDGCFGAINYFVADMNHTDVEFSTTETVLKNQDSSAGIRNFAPQ